MSISDIVWSDSQQKVIEANSERIIVSASAGSGKTTVMIGRILRLLREGVKIENMLICTFTKASAADMRTKLYRELTECVQNKKLDSSLRSSLKAELRSLSRADISTIDSFCQRLVSKYFYLIGIDPQFEVLDENESFALKIEAIERSINKLREDGDELYEIFCRKRRTSQLSEALLSIMEFDSINTVQATCDYSRDKTARKLGEFIAEEERKLEGAIAKLFEVVDEPEKQADLLSALKSGVTSFSRKKLDKKNEMYKPCIDYLKERIKKFVDTKREFSELRPQSESDKLTTSLINAARFAEALYDDEKKKRAALDFADLEKFALRILQSGGEEIRGKYKYIFVDEYQDINPLQECLIGEVAKGNNLFMVGDLKQSIYAFRGCEPLIFKQKYDMYTRHIEGEAFNLDANYRSDKHIIDFVNSVFETVMTEDFGGVDYKKNPMRATERSDGEGYVKLHVIKGGERSPYAKGVYSVMNDTDEKQAKKDAEANLIASRVLDLIRSGAAFGDIAILTRSMGSLEEAVVYRLHQLNIPLSLKEKAYYLFRPETGQLIDYLRLIDNRRDDKALFVSMLSPLGGFDENELAEIKALGKDKFFECAEEAALTNEKVKRFYDTLNSYYELSQTVEADELCGEIVSECGYFNYAYSMGEDAAEVLDKFLEFLGKCPAKDSLYGCLKYIDERNPFAELSGDENSVRLMTVHKSKGLEFKYVLVIGLGEQFNLSDLTKPILTGSNVAMCVYDNHEEFDSDFRFEAKQRLRKKQLEEELRIFYVALTRAKFGLELFAGVPENDLVTEAFACGVEGVVDFSAVTSPARWLAKHLPLVKAVDASEITVEEAKQIKVNIGKPDDELTDSLSDYFGFEFAKPAPAKSYVSKLAHKDDEPAIIMFSDGDGDALERGNAYHRAMEIIDFSHPIIHSVSSDDLRLIDVDSLLAAAENMRRFSGVVYKEKPFMLKLSASEAGVEGTGNVLVQGVIDLLVIDGDEAKVIDYKTGRAHSGFESGYFKQVNLYAEAVERLLGKKVTEKYLYYFDERLFVEVK